MVHNSNTVFVSLTLQGWCLFYWQTFSFCICILYEAVKAEAVKAEQVTYSLDIVKFEVLPVRICLVFKKMDRFFIHLVLLLYCSNEVPFFCFALPYLDLHFILPYIREKRKYSCLVIFGILKKILRILAKQLK